LVLVSCSRKIKIDGIKIIDYGIYKTKLIQNKSSITGNYQVRKVIHIIKSSDKIKIKKNIIFGFRYLLLGNKKNKIIQLKLVNKYPRLTKNNKTYNTTFVSIDRIIGATNFEGYILNNDFEMIQGTWIFTLFYENKKIGEKSFTLFE